ncbi:MAG: aldose 1-epimerase [Hominimerdicola sp.]
MNSIDLEFSFKGHKCVKLQSANYTCIIAPSLGASVLRLRDDENNVEFFRYDKNCSMETINEQREVWGLPTLYLPNRFDRGVLKTSDGEYLLPINETLLDNFIHGWVHKRPHEIECYSTQNRKAVLVTSYIFNEKDEMYKYFPLKFKISYTFTLSSKGLLQEIYLTNNSEKSLPVSICTHTCLNAPMFDGGKEENMRLFVPIGEKCELNERCLPTERLLLPTDSDKEYLSGKKPTLQVIDNEMYTAETGICNGKPFYGAYIKDISTGKTVCNEVSKEFKFWNMWNDGGNNGYFCPEPMTAMINAPNLSLDSSVTGYSEITFGHTYKCWQRFYTL